MKKLNHFIFNILLFLHPLELLKKFLKILVVSKEIALNRISYYPKLVIKFEEKFARYVGKENGLSFSNGTSSIEAALFSFGLGRGDEVLVPSCTFHASISPIVNCGAVPVFVDVEQGSLCPSVIEFQKRLTSRTRCVLVVHPFGFLADIAEIREFADQNRLRLIEDVSHAHGASVANRRVGSFGDVSCFSLQGAKAIAAGEGGIAVTDNPVLFARMSMFGHFNRHEAKFSPSDVKYRSTGIGHKMRAHPLGIALADIDLKFCDLYNHIMRKNTAYIQSRLSRVDGISIFHGSSEAQFGGFFGGLPFLVDPQVMSVEDVLEVFRCNAFNVSRYPWPMHHRLELFGEGVQSELKNTEFLMDNLLLLDRRILFFLPLFKKRDLRKTLRMLSELSRS